jgi:diadenosine tetraphosphate (Ap4A) HIT family hydrolase
MNNFKVHPQLLADCHVLGTLDSGQLLLHRNAALPWFILVPETDCEDLLDLPDEARAQVMSDAKATADFIKAHFGLTKINVAALGNVVPQLHLHVIGRSHKDPCWPNPVWGNLTVKEIWPEEVVKNFSAQLCG